MSDSVGHSPKHRFRLTPEQARDAAAKSHESRRMNKLRQSVSPESASEQPKEQPPKPDDYLLRRLSRMRYQLDMIDKAIQKELQSDEPNGQRLNWLCAAQERLSEQERQLAGRPLPGSFRPTVSKAKSNVAASPEPD